MESSSTRSTSMGSLTIVQHRRRASRIGLHTHRTAVTRTIVKEPIEVDRVEEDSIGSTDHQLLGRVICEPEARCQVRFVPRINGAKAARSVERQAKVVSPCLTRTEV